MLSLLLSSAALLGQTPATGFTAPYPVSSPVRAALTPLIDGRIEPEEWDALSDSNGAATYFQWEPDYLYWAATARNDQEIVLSLDQNGDGWLVGRDNLEIRFRLDGANLVQKTRVLDAASGMARWIEGGLPPESVKFAIGGVNNSWSLEAAYIPRLGSSPKPGMRLGARIDVLPLNAPMPEAYQPRSLAALILQLDSSRLIPGGMAWRPSIVERSVAREDRIKLKFELERLEGRYDPRRIEIRGEGLARDVLGQVAQPLTRLDGKGRTSIDYETVIDPSASTGWRVIRGTIKDAAGQEFIIRSSIRISELLDFDIQFPTGAQAKSEAQIIRGSVILRSQYSGRVEGEFSFVAPPDWTISKGRSQKFLIYHPRGTSKAAIEFIIPRASTGVFPLRFRANVGERTIEKTVYFAVE